MLNKIFIEIRLRNLMAYVFKGHVKIMVKFNVSIVKRLEIVGSNYAK